MIDLRIGDCREVMAAMEPESVDAIVCDPPYGLEFMGKEWDKLDGGLPQEGVWKGRRGQGGSSVGDDNTKPSSRHRVNYGGSTRAQFKRCTICGKRQFSGSPCQCESPEWTIEHTEGAPSSAVRMQRWHETWAREAFRVLKPGGHLLAFSGTRTSHRMVCAIEDAGFEIRDSIVWLYGSGFPKSLDVSKAIDKAAGRSGEYGEPKSAAHAGWIERGRMRGDNGHEGHQRPWMDDPEAVDRNARQYIPATPDAERWQGWGTALKPAHEPVVVARKPLIGTVAANVTAWGTGALNVDGCRITSGPTAIINAWEHDHNLCNSCAVDAANNPKLATLGIGESTARNNAEPTTNGRAQAHHADTFKTDTGCSVGLNPAEPNGNRSGDSSSSIGESGNNITAQSPTDTSFTTSTTTRSTTASRTCNSCGAAITSGTTQPLGRWPSNVILGHHEDCVPVGTRRVKSQAPIYRRDAQDAAPDDGVILGKMQPQPAGKQIGYADADGMETVAAWDCHPDCAVAMLDAQSGNRKGAVSNGRKGKPQLGIYSDRGPQEQIPAYADTGGASRYFFVARDNSTQDSQAGIIQAWERPDQSHNDPTDATLPARATCVETTADGCDSSTSLSGKNATGQSLTVGKSITSTKTSRTTGSRTSNSEPLPTTNGFTAGANCETESGSSRVQSAASSSPLTLSTGISADKGGRSTDDAARATSDEWLPINSGDELRFRYQAKASRSERNAGLEPPGNIHATVKPVALMQWLVRLVTPPGGTVMDPFMGSGSTGIACVREGVDFIGIEMSDEYAEIARRRIEHAERTIPEPDPQLALPMTEVAP